MCSFQGSLNFFQIPASLHVPFAVQLYLNEWAYSLWVIMPGSPWFTSCCFALYGHISVRELYLACPNWLSCTLCLIFFKNVSRKEMPKKISLDVNFSGFYIFLESPELYFLYSKTVTYSTTSNQSPSQVVKIMSSLDRNLFLYTLVN